jgi:hypothetical protein
MWPVTITINMPTASTPVIVAWRMRFEKLRASRNTPPVVYAKISQIAISAKTIV